MAAASIQFSLVDLAMSLSISTISTTSAKIKSSGKYQCRINAFNAPLA